MESPTHSHQKRTETKLPWPPGGPLGPLLSLTQGLLPTRCQPMRPGRRTRWFELWSYPVLLLAIGGPAALRADDTPALVPAALSGMHPTALSQSFSQMRGTWSPTPLAPVLQLTLDGALQPLRVRDDARNYVPWVDGLVDAQLSAAIGLTKSIRFSAELPFRLALLPDARWPGQSPDPVALPDALAAQGMGDVLLELQYQLLSPSGSAHLGLTLLPALQLPTGQTTALAGEGSIQGLLGIAAFDTLETGPLQGAILAANVGMRWRSTPVWIPGGSLLHQLEYRVGISLPGPPQGNLAPQAALAGTDARPAPASSRTTPPTEQSLVASKPSQSGGSKPIHEQGPLAQGPLARWSLERWSLELVGSLPVSTYTSPLPPPLSALISARVSGGTSWTLLPALSLGLQPGYGVPSAELGLGLQYWKDPAADADQDGIIDRLDGCPTQAEDLDNHNDADGCPDQDNDQDGNPDPSDRCPDQAEDPDRFADEDGCPDFDNDQDGVPDASDQCPLSAEDRDGWQDTDGCVDPDNDGDGVLEPLDGCPDAREDRDGFQDDDGCPELDNDGDGINDLLDQCPDAPETAPSPSASGGAAFAGVVADGCPDPEPALLAATPPLTPGSSLSLSGPLVFEKNSTRLTPESTPVLEEVLRLLLSNPQLRLRIETHTDDKGSASHNRALSQRRADALKTTLVKSGVPDDHLEAVGMGEATPLMPELTDEARRANRRVVWIVLPPTDLPTHNR